MDAVITGITKIMLREAVSTCNALRSLIYNVKRYNIQQPA